MKKQTAEAARLRLELTPSLQRSMDLGSEKGASSWLMTLPIREHNFALPKGSFRDAICLRYIRMETTTLAISLYLWNELLRRACSQLLMWWIPNCKVVDGGVPQCGNRAASTASNSEDRAILDVCAQGFWGDRHQRAFFDVRVFNLLAPSNCRSSLTSAYRHHETQKRRRYEERVWEIEPGSFTPLLFLVLGSCTPGRPHR